MKILKVTLENQQRVIDYLRKDAITHVFAFYDLQKDFEKTAMHVASDNKEIIGYTLTYSGADVPSVVLKCRSDVAERLLQHAPQGNFILHTSPNNRKTIIERYPEAKIYVENWMLVDQNKAKVFHSKLTRRLVTPKDASLLADLLHRRKDRPERNLKRYIEWISRMPVYGVFENDALVSYAGSFIQLPEIWMIGGVYTLPERRNRGYALLATSAVTQEALKKAKVAALFVRSDNYPAMKVYEKIGYRKIGEEIWVDKGTGLIP